MPLTQLLLMIALGLLGGTIGGLLGLGGGVIVIPALTIALGPDQHYYQASMMLVYIVTALPAAWRHHKSQAVRFDALRGLVPASVITILFGVWLGNRFDEADLRRVFVLFLAYVIVTDFIRLIHEFHKSGKASFRAEHDTDKQAAPPQFGVASSRAAHDSAHRPEEPHPVPVPVPRSLIVGTFTGVVSGLLGVGGGIVAVPLLQRIARLNLRQAIGTSTAIILVTGSVGAIAKVSTLQATTAGTHTALDALQLAAFLAPGAIAGGYLGASLTHRIPIPWVRTAFLILLTLSALQMSGLVSFTQLFTS